MEWAKFYQFSLEGTPEDRRQLEGMIAAAARFTRAVKEQRPPFWLSFLGTSGAGKTYLARRIWKWFKRSPLFTATVDPETREIQYPGEWCDWPELAGELLGNQGYAQLNDLKSEKFVVLDEIGADRDPSGHVRDCLARVLSARVGMWTIMTSNKSLGEIQRDIDTRISSRMLRDGSLVVDVDVTDFALRKAVDAT